MDAVAEQSAKISFEELLKQAFAQLSDYEKKSISLILRLYKSAEGLEENKLRMTKYLVEDIDELIRLVSITKGNNEIKGQILKEIKELQINISKYMKGSSKEVQEKIKENITNINNLNRDFVVKKDEHLVANNQEEKTIKEEQKQLFDNQKELHNRVNIEINKAVSKLKKNLKPFDFRKLDEAYRKLYIAIEKNNRKEIINVRGRLIKLLKTYKDNIRGKYSELKCLDEMKAVFDSEETIEIKLAKIDKILRKKGNEDFENYFHENKNNYSELKKDLLDIYEFTEVKKLRLYLLALKKELKNQSIDLKEEYRHKMIDEKRTVTVLTNTFPKTMNLSIKKVKNTMDELKETRTKRQKKVKIKELAKDIGRVITTPGAVSIKFVASNWYTLYMLANGYKKAKEQKEALEAQLKQQEGQAEQEEQDEEKGNLRDRGYPSSSEESPLNGRQTETHNSNLEFLESVSTENITIHDIDGKEINLTISSIPNDNGLFVAVDSETGTIYLMNNKGYFFDENLHAIYVPPQDIQSMLMWTGGRNEKLVYVYDEEGTEYELMVSTIPDSLGEFEARDQDGNTYRIDTDGTMIRTDGDIIGNAINLNGDSKDYISNFLQNVYDTLEKATQAQNMSSITFQNQLEEKAAKEQAMGIYREHGFTDEDVESLNTTSSNRFYQNMMDARDGAIVNYQSYYKMMNNGEEISYEDAARIVDSNLNNTDPFYYNTLYKQLVDDITLFQQELAADAAAQGRIHEIEELLKDYERYTISGLTEARDDVERELARRGVVRNDRISNEDKSKFGVILPLPLDLSAIFGGDAGSGWSIVRLDYDSENGLEANYWGGSDILGAYGFTSNDQELNEALGLQESDPTLNETLDMLDNAAKR